MMVRNALLLCSLFALFIAMPRVAVAQLTPGVIEVHVINEATRRPISEAAVSLIGGPTPVRGYTDAEGGLIFRDAQPQAYVVEVRRDGYRAASAQRFDVNENTIVRLTFELSPLAIIGRTQASSNVRIGSSRIDESSPERRISATLLDALGKLTGVTVLDTPGGGNAISLNGQDPTATGYAINGVSVGGSTTNANLAQDLFTGANVSFSPTIGYLGGTINYQTLRPTIAPQFRLSGNLGSYQSYAGSGSFTGSLGKWGIALQESTRGIDSFLNGRTYADQSGVSFTHSGALNRAGSAEYVKYAPSDRSFLSISSIRATQYNDEICARFITNLACGFGPNARTDQDYRALIAEGSVFIGSIQLASTVTTTWSGNNLDQSRRTILGVPSPLDSRSTDRYRGVTLVALSELGRHSLSARYATYTDDGTTSAVSLSAGVAQHYDASRWQANQTFQLSDTFHVNPKVSLATDLTRTSAAGSIATGGSGTSLHENAVYKANGRDSFTVDALIGRAAPSLVPLIAPSVPTSADFNCASGSTSLIAPSDAPTAQSTFSSSAGWTRNWSGSTLQLVLGTQSARGVNRQILVPYSTTPSAFGLPYGTVISELSSLWSNSAICGGSTFNPQAVYLNQYVSGLNQHSTYATLSGRLRLRKANILVVPGLTLQRLYFTKLDHRFEDPMSLYRDGKQIYGVPSSTFGVTVDGFARAHLEWLVNARHISANNVNNLPPYTVVSLGVSLHGRTADYTFLWSNIGNVGGGPFTRDMSGSVTTVAGSALTLPSTPLQPQQWLFTFTPRLGRTR